MSRLLRAAVWSIDRSKSCRNNYEGIWTRSFTHFTSSKGGGLCAAGENGLQDISTLLPGLIGFIDFLVVVPRRLCLPWKRINIPPFVRREMRIDGHRNLVNGRVSYSELCFRWIPWKLFQISRSTSRIIHHEYSLFGSFKSPTRLQKFLKIFYKTKVYCLKLICIGNETLSAYGGEGNTFTCASPNMFLRARVIDTTLIAT